MKGRKNTKKAFAKALTWRGISTATTFLMVWAWFGEWKTATGFALVEAAIKFTQYYLHELAWQGRLKNAKRRTPY